MTSSRFPVWHDVLAQFDLAGAWTPDPFHLLFLMGLPLVIAVAGFDGCVPLRERSLPQIFVRVWFMAGFFLLYVPLNFQIHFLNGWQLPIAVLATEILFRRILPFFRSRESHRAHMLTKWVPIVLLAAVIPTNLYLFAWRFIALGRYQHPYFIHRDEDAALEWLAENAEADDIVLSAQDLGQYVPGRTDARSFLGHWAMTKDLHEKQDLVKSFFDAEAADSERRAVLSEFGVDYVLRGVVERRQGEFDPASVAYLAPCFVAPEATVYCVRETQLVLTED
jgi:hypothetical protein